MPRESSTWLTSCGCTPSTVNEIAAPRSRGSAGRDAIIEHEHGLISHALEALRGIDGLRILGPAEPVDRGAAISFTVDGVHPHDVSQVLDSRGIAVRAGHHCAWPLHRAMGVQASTRASFYLYNTHEEVDALAASIREAQRFFGVRGG